MTSAQVSSDAWDNVEKIGDRSGTARGSIARNHGERKMVAELVEPGNYRRQEDDKEWSPWHGIALRTSDAGDMNGDYVFLCGVMWCAYGQ